MVSEFADQLVKIEAENGRLKAELKASGKLVVDEALKNDKLEKEMAKLKKDLDKEVKARKLAESALGQATKLHESIEALLGKIFFDYLIVAMYLPCC